MLLAALWLLFAWAPAPWIACRKAMQETTVFIRKIPSAAFVEDASVPIIVKTLRFHKLGKVV